MLRSPLFITPIAWADLRDNSCIAQRSHRMDSAVQPILCCLGQAVGACPTQYLMELSFADRGVDWRAITVEVQCEDLEAAVHGAEAMGFRGLRFFGDMQNLASEVLSLSGLGLPISSAMRTELGWRTWHSAGCVLRDVIDMHLPESTPCELILFGDTPQTRTICGGLVGAYSDADASLLQANEVTDNQASFCRASWVGVEGAVVPSRDQLKVYGTVAPLLASRENESDLMATCLVGCDPEVAAEFAALVGEQNPTSQVLWLPGEEHVSKASNENAAYHKLSRSELFLRAEQEDFFRWTERRVSLALLRDAFDEFNAF